MASYGSEGGEVRTPEETSSHVTATNTTGETVSNVPATPENAVMSTEEDGKNSGSASTRYVRNMVYPWVRSRLMPALLYKPCLDYPHYRINLGSRFRDIHNPLPRFRAVVLEEAGSRRN